MPQSPQAAPEVPKRKAFDTTERITDRGRVIFNAADSTRQRAHNVLTTAEMAGGW